MSVITGSSGSGLLSRLRHPLDQQRGLLGCGVVSSVLYLVSIDVIAALRHPDYHRYADQMVSELMAVNAPTRPLLVSLFVPYNLMVFAFSIGVWKAAGKRKMLRFTAMAIAGYGIVSSAGLLLTPMDLRGTVDSHRDTPHIFSTIVMSVFIIAAMAFGAQTGTRLFRAYTHLTIGVVLVFGAIAGYLARPMPEPTPWVGLAERVNIYATMIWFALFALSVELHQRAKNGELS